MYSPLQVVFLKSGYASRKDRTPNKSDMEAAYGLIAHIGPERYDMIQIGIRIDKGASPAPG